MSTRKTTVFSGVLIAVTFFVIGLVLASRMDMAPSSSAQTIAVPQMNSAPITGPLDAQTFRNIAKVATPWVVNIRTESRQRMTDLTEFFGGQGGGDDLFHRFFGEPQPDQGGSRRRPQRDQIAVAAGSGFIIDKAGFILTNNHVVEGATKIEVALYGDEEQEYAARVIGRDPLTDSALIELTEKPDHTLPEAKFGDSDQVAPGDWVMAIGNPFNLSHTVSVGVVSASGRPFNVAEGRWQNVIQTDAAINPGNSGGPLLNLRGEVVGINTAIYSNERAAGNIGIGFAIPINVVRGLLPQLRAGKITRGRIGVQVGVVTRDAAEQFGLKERKGALVSLVDADGPAARAGLEPGDLIVEYNGKPVANRDALVTAVQETKPGASVPIKVIRDQKERTLSVKVEELDLESENSASARGREREQPEEQAANSFGMSLQDLTSDMARRLRVPQGQEGVLITDVDPSGPAGRSALRQGDVILEINRRPVSSASEAARALNAVQAGRTASFLIWRGGQEIFVIVRKQ
jgi:serine protease Do